MKNDKMRLSGSMLSFLIIIISFIYAINIQPKVIGDSENQDVIKLTSDSGKQSVVSPDIYGIFKLKGTYIYKLSIDNAFECSKKISRLDKDEISNDNFPYYMDLSIHKFTRSFYLNNNLNNLSESNSKKLR